MPLLFLLYIVSYLDRANVGFAKLQMSKLPGFSESVFGWGFGIFFVGYLLLEIPGRCWWNTGAPASGSPAS